MIFFTCIYHVSLLLYMIENNFYGQHIVNVYNHLYHKSLLKARKKMIQKKALRYTRGVQIPKIKRLWLLILVSILIKITSRILSGLS